MRGTWTSVHQESALVYPHTNKWNTVAIKAQEQDLARLTLSDEEEWQVASQIIQQEGFIAPAAE